MVAHGAGGAVGDVGAVHRLAPGGLERRRSSASTATRRGSGSTPTVAGSHAVEVTLLPPDEVLGRRTRTEVPSDEAGMRRFERPEQLPPDLAGHPHLPVRRRLRHLRVRVRRRRDRPLSCSRPTGAGVPAATELVDEVADRTDLSLCGASRRRARGRLVIARGVVPSRSSLRVVVARGRSPCVDHIRVAAPARHPARVGHRAARRASSAGGPRRSWR